MAPTSVSSRFNARPNTPFGNSIISLSITSLNPSMRATPSPVSRTTPTLLLVADVFSPAIFVSISSRMLLIISSWCWLARRSLGEGGLKLLLKQVESIADGGLPHVAAHAHPPSHPQRL